MGVGVSSLRPWWCSHISRHVTPTTHREDSQHSTLLAARCSGRLERSFAPPPARASVTPAYDTAHLWVSFSIFVLTVYSDHETCHRVPYAPPACAVALLCYNSTRRQWHPPTARRAEAAGCFEVVAATTRALGWQCQPIMAHARRMHRRCCCWTFKTTSSSTARCLYRAPPILCRWSTHCASSTLT